MELRWYQRAAIDASFQWLCDHPDPLQSPAIVLPTGAGKSPVMAEIANIAATQWGLRTLIVAHRKELVEQNAEKVRLMSPRMPVGIYSAGLKRRDTQQQVIVAGIQSIYKRAPELGAFGLILFDECHLIPNVGANDEGMYQTFLRDTRVVNPQVRLIGLTATDYRLGSGRICKSENILNEVAYEVGVNTLIEGGFLSSLVSRVGHRYDWSNVKVRGGEFENSSMETAAMANVADACNNLAELTKDRHSVLVFACGVLHGETVNSYLHNTLEQDCAIVTGETKPHTREMLLESFKRGRLKYLINVDVLTTGFDAPNIDCVAMLRPTMSAGLYYQMVGRGFRLHHTKTDCLVLDYAGNIDRHGPVDSIEVCEKTGKSEPGEAPEKACPDCGLYTYIAARECEDCGYEFPPPGNPKHEAVPADQDVLSGNGNGTTVERFEVKDCWWAVHKKKDAPADAPKTMRVEYLLGVTHLVKEWVCFEHTGYARTKAEDWWRHHASGDCPETSAEAVRLANEGKVGIPDWIEVESKRGQHDQIVGRGPVVGAVITDEVVESDKAREEYETTHQRLFFDDAPF